MNIKDYARLLFNKKKMVKVNIYRDDRRFSTHIREPKGATVDVDGKTYMVKNELVFLSGSLPTLNYYHDNPEPFNMTTGNIEGFVTPDEINATINNTVYKNMISDMLKGEQKLINTILISTGIILLVLAGGLYLVYSKQMEILTWIEENKDLFASIRRSLLEGGFN